ncbi:MAG: MFS transporter [Chloroflexi bacterium]|nr:MFS transporter [Chloroflexota bacterium]
MVTLRAGGRLPFHYAWVVVAVGALLGTVTGATRLSFGVFIDPLAETFGWNRSLISLAFTIQYIAMGIASVWVGLLVDRLGARLVLIGGGVVFVAATVLTGLSRELWQFYLAYGLVLGTAMAVFLTPIHTTLLVWFRSRLGLAIGICVAAQGLGTMFFAPVLRYVSSITTWDLAFLVIAAATAVLLVPGIALYRNAPREVGLSPYGEQPTTPGGQAVEPVPTVDGATLMRRAVRTQPFWVLIAAHLFGCIGHAIPLVHVVSMGTATGLSGVTAAGVLGLVNGVSIASRFGMPLIAARFGGKAALALTLSLQGTSILVLIGARELWQFVVFAIFFGLGFGGEMVVFPMLNREYYGSAPMGSVYGWQMFGAGLGMGIGGFLGGLFFDLSGSYTSAILAAAAASYAGVAAILVIQPPEPAVITRPKAAAVPAGAYPEVVG